MASVMGMRRLPKNQLKVRPRFRQVPTYVILVVIAALTVFPFYAMLMLSATRSGTPLPDALAPVDLTTENFRSILSGGLRLARWSFNSLVYAVVSVFLVLLISSMAGYGFAKKRFPGNQVIFWSILATLMIPFQVTLIPLFILVADLGGVNTYWGLVAPTLANAAGVFLMRQFVGALPDELFESAKLDGASELRMYFDFVLPLTRPALATLGVFVFLWHWNDLLWPLVVAQSDDMRTLTVGLATFQLQNPEIGPLMATATVSFLPSLLVFVVLQRYYVQGVARAGLKG